jgi:molybdate transport system substrate-binding protein
MTHSLSLPFTGCVFLGASLLGVAVNAAEVKVFSSPAASGALTEVVPQFERATGHKVLLDFANIAATRKRIAAGETFDIAIVSPKAIEELLQQGTIAAGTQYNIGRTGLGVVTRKGAAKPDIGSVDAFKRSLLGAKSVGYSATGESGIGFMSVLDRLGIASEMKPTIKPAANLTNTVDAGEVDFGITGVGAARQREAGLRRPAPCRHTGLRQPRRGRLRERQGAAGRPGAAQVPARSSCRADHEVQRARAVLRAAFPPSRLSMLWPQLLDRRLRLATSPDGANNIDKKAMLLSCETNTLFLI